jgi:phosphatidylserine synthase
VICNLLNIPALVMRKSAMVSPADIDRSDGGFLEQGALLETSEPIRRTSEIEEITNLYLIHPIASFLTPIFARLRISANAVSLAGMALGGLAGVAYYNYRDARWALAGFILMIAWHVMDGADGQLARLTNSQSELGKVLDGICDYVTFIAVYSALAAALTPRYGGWVWALAIVAGICHSVQAAAYEVQRQEYNFWGWDQKSAEFLPLDARPGRVVGGPIVPRVADAIHRLYVRCQVQVAGVVIEFHRKLAALLAAQPERTEFIRERYRTQFARSVRVWSVMSANYRTLGIFVAVIAGKPLYYFWFEIVGFNLIMIFLISRQRAAYERFFAGI